MLNWALAGVVFLFVIAYMAPHPSNPPPQPASQYASLTPDQIKAKSAIVSYDLLARFPAKYTGQLVTFRGKVIQTVQEGRNYTLRVNVSREKYGWSDTIYVDYRTRSADEPRILEGDVIQLWGEYAGITSYKALLGQTVQIPRVAALGVRSSPGD